MSTNTNTAPVGISPLEQYAEYLATTAVQQLRQTDSCVNAAQTVQDLFTETIAGRQDLADHAIQCGVIFDVETFAATEKSEAKRGCHLSSFLLAKSAASIQFLGIDGYFGGTWKKAANCALGAVAWQNFTPNSVVYAQIGRGAKGWKAGQTTDIRAVPYRMNPNYRRQIILGEEVGRQSLQELLSKATVKDKTKLPVLLMKM